MLPIFNYCCLLRQKFQPVARGRCFDLLMWSPWKLSSISGRRENHWKLRKYLGFRPYWLRNRRGFLFSLGLWQEASSFLACQRCASRQALWLDTWSGHRWDLAVSMSRSKKHLLQSRHHHHRLHLLKVEMIEVFWLTKTLTTVKKSRLLTYFICLLERWNMNEMNSEGTDGESKNSPSESVFGDNRVKIVLGYYLSLPCKH